MTHPNRERTVISNDGKDEIIVTVRRDIGQKRHIFITVPADMKWTTIWRTLRKLPKLLQKQRKQKTKPLQKKFRKKELVA